MITFWVGIVILLGGGFLYSRYCEHVFRPDNRQTPAYRLRDGVDYVPMGKGKTALIELLNIAGTGPILGPIQGILFGPVAFLLIPIGNVLGGAMHDYFSGMISLRNDGAQMPVLIKNYLGKPVFAVYNLFLALLLILVAAVFVYTPGDLFVSHILRQAPSADNPWVWVVYGVIFLYYMAATLLPIDKIIGRIYPVFGAVLLFSAIGVVRIPLARDRDSADCNFDRQGQFVTMLGAQRRRVIGAVFCGFRAVCFQMDEFRCRRHRTIIRQRSGRRGIAVCRFVPGLVFHSQPGNGRQRHRPAVFAFRQGKD